MEGGWTQKRLFDVDWSETSQCQACQTEEGTEKHRLYHCPEWYEVRREIPDFSMRKWESEKHKSWCTPTEGFKGHVAIDGSLLGIAGKW